MENLSAGIEMGAEQTTTVGLFTLLVPAGVPLTAYSVITDETGDRYEVEGDPAARRDPRTNRVIYQAAALRRVSDLRAVG